MKLFQYLIGYLCFILASTYPLLAQADNTGEITVEIEQTVQSGNYLLAVPPKTISSSSTIQLIRKGERITARVSPQLLWPENTISAGNKHYIRLLNIHFSQPPAIERRYQLKWQSGENNPMPESPVNQPNSFGLMTAEQGWLSRSLLLHPENKGNYSEWYLGSQRKYALYITDRELLSKRNYPLSKASQWLYDSPQALYQLYVMTQEPMWKPKADFMSLYYQDHIDDTGYFDHKPRDIKYLNGRGLLFRYMLNGDPESIKALKRLFQASLKWNPVYSLERGFWTERHQAAALSTALAYWEASNDPKALKRINEIVDATYTMTFDSAWSNRNCPQHALKAHEGKGDQSAVCSPWMMSLLADSLWRFYHLTQSQKAEELIIAFGEFVLKDGTYYPREPKLKGQILSMYLWVPDNPKAIEINGWRDLQHNCDIAALVGKATFLKKQQKKDYASMKELFEIFAERCRKNHVKSPKTIQAALKPLRKFGWEYSSTSDMPWLVEELLDWKGISVHRP
ncbi:MAG: hypothetical protein V7739_02795 [Motiliproteus sp.]